VIKSLVQVCWPRCIGQNVMIHLVVMEWYIKFLRVVIKSVVELCLPKIGLKHLDPAKCDRIPCTSVTASERWWIWNDTLSSTQIPTKLLYRYVRLRALVKMKWYIKPLPCVNKSLVQVCLPDTVCKNGMINSVPANRDQITFTSMCP
jgi:hypothetical protein